MLLQLNYKIANELKNLFKYKYWHFLWTVILSDSVIDAVSNNSLKLKNNSNNFVIFIIVHNNKIQALLWLNPERPSFVFFFK